MMYLFSALLTGGVLTAICWPLFSRRETLDAAVLEETEWDLLQRRKEVALGNIQDLDFEFKCGKLSEDDYKKVRRDMTAEAAQVLEEIDRIEASQDLDALIRTEVVARKERIAGLRVCAGCGHPNTPQNKFCAECGARVAPRQG